MGSALAGVGMGLAGNPLGWAWAGYFLLWAEACVGMASRGFGWFFHVLCFAWARLGMGWSVTKKNMIWRPVEC
jgi:hypothetical protein